MEGELHDNCDSPEDRLFIKKVVNATNVLTAVVDGLQRDYDLSSKQMSGIIEIWLESRKRLKE